MDDTIPKTLCQEQFRFVLIQARKKRPFEMDWQNTANYAFDDPKFLQHLKDGGNYGVLCGCGGLTVIDADEGGVRQAVEGHLPETFTVQTGRGGMHFYYICPDLEKSIRLRDSDGAIGHPGDIQHKKKQVVGPGSTHPNGKQYQLVKDVSIAVVKASQIRAVLRDFRKDEATETKDEERQQATRAKVPIDDLNITDVVDLVGLKRHGNDYQGPHPIHGSSTGSNFHVTPSKNVWYCFRHDSGGGPLNWIGVKHGIIRCDEAVSGALRDDKFKQVLKVAEKKYGLKIPKLKKSRKKKGEDPYQHPTDMAEIIMEERSFKTVIDTEELYIYNDGAYHLKGEPIVKETVVKMDPEKSSHYAQEVIHQIKARTYFPREEFDKDINLHHLKNGIFDLNDKSLSPFSPDIITTISIPVEYKEGADCPVVETFIKEVLNSEDIPVIQELFGYCLFRSYPIQKSFMFVGEGANGKSTLLELLRTFLGRENTTSVPLQDIDINRFASSALYGKLANIYADLPDKSLKQTGKFKTLTGGDSIQAEKKFKSSFNFVNYAKLIFSTNKLPQTYDETDAFFRRWIIITFQNTFEGKEADKNLLKKMTTPEEMSGLFNWAIEGLSRLLENGEFSYSATTAEIRTQYERMSAPLLAFVQDCVDTDPEAWISKDGLYSAYTKYCRSNRLPITAKNVIGRELPRFVPLKDEKRKTHQGRKTGWAGIRLKDNKEERDEDQTPLESFEDDEYEVHEDEVGL